MKITFTLPGVGNAPCGGFKVVYEYANRLVARGHEIVLVHSCGSDANEIARNKARNLARYIAYGCGYKGGYLPTSWFALDPRVAATWVPSLHKRWIPDGDAVVATAWDTAEWVSEYPSTKGKRYYLIQHLEVVFPESDSARVLATWRAPLCKIVIAEWLREAAVKLGEKAVYIPNGLSESFYLDVPIDSRDPYRIAMMYHDRFEWKGSADGIEALILAKQRVPQLYAELFGLGPRLRSLPDWISFCRRPSLPDLRRLYNEASIFIAPSRSEGCAAPPGEAMRCGAAVCATDIGGHHEYAAHGFTSLLSPPRDPLALARNIVRLVHNQDLRIQIAGNGHHHIQQFTWDRATSALACQLVCPDW